MNLSFVSSSDLGHFRIRIDHRLVKRIWNFLVGFQLGRI